MKTKNYSQLFINGEWVDSSSDQTITVLNPSTEEVIAAVPHANEDDVDQAVTAAKEAFPAWNTLPVSKRIDLLMQLADAIEEHQEEILELIIEEMGTARDFGRTAQVGRSISEIRSLVAELDHFEFKEEYEGFDVIKEGFGVVACITPWNYPLNQIQRKITPALLAGNTVVVKPASNTPLAGFYLTHLIEKIGFPAGVFNFVTGGGSDTGNYLAGHEDVSVISFTGSTEVGRGLYEKAAPKIKHLILELGGKSAMIYLQGGDLNTAVEQAMDAVLNNTGQSCSALTRLLVPESLLDEAKNVIRDYYEKKAIVGNPIDNKTIVGPQISKDQQERVESYIQKGKDEGATVFLGGEKMEGKGFFVQPTVFTDVTNDMTIAQEEIFGPVLCVLSYSTVNEAIEIANDSPYGLSGAVVGPGEEAYQVASQLRTGNILINGSGRLDHALFGGYKQSGLGREVGLWGLEDYLEEKALFYKK